MTVLGITDIGTYVNNVFPNGEHHYITLYLEAKACGEPRVMEPDKCEGWAWFTPGALPSPLFLPFQKFVDEHGLR